MLLLVESKSALSPFKVSSTPALLLGSLTLGVQQKIEILKFVDVRTPVLVIVVAIAL